MSPAHETQSMREIPAKRGRVNRYGTLPSYIFYEAPLMGQERHNPTGTSDLTLSFIFEESLLCPRCYACFRAENLLMGRKSRFEALNICFTHKCVFQMILINRCYNGKKRRELEYCWVFLQNYVVYIKTLNCPSFINNGIIMVFLYHWIRFSFSNLHH